MLKLGDTTRRGHFFLKNNGAIPKNDKGSSLFIAKSWEARAPIAPRFLRVSSWFLINDKFTRLLVNINNPSGILIPCCSHMCLSSYHEQHFAA